MRLCPFSSSASDRLENDRGLSSRTLPWLSVVVPLNSSDVKVKAMSSVPKTWRSVWKTAPPKVACPDG